MKVGRDWWVRLRLPGESFPIFGSVIDLSNRLQSDSASLRSTRDVIMITMNEYIYRSGG